MKSKKPRYHYKKDVFSKTEKAKQVRDFFHKDICKKIIVIYKKECGKITKEQIAYFGNEDFTFGKAILLAEKDGIKQNQILRICYG